MKHTPGPWVVVYNEMKRGVYKSTIVSDKSNVLVAETYSNAMEEDDANASLIANAPEMLEVMSKLHSAMRLLHITGDDSTLSELKEAEDLYRDAVKSYFDLMRKMEIEP